MRTTVLFPLSGIVRCLYTVSSFAFCASLCRADGIDARFLVEQMERRATQVKTLYLKAVWNEYKDGALTSTSEQTLHRDEFRRIRVRSVSGASPANRRVTDCVYNGELTARYFEDATLNRVGEPHAADSREQDAHYVTAMIHDGLFPPGIGPHDQRNPLTFLELGVAETLRDCIANGKTVTITPQSTDSSIFEVRYDTHTPANGTSLAHLLRFDKSKDWTIASHEQSTAGEAAPRVRLTADYRPTASGFWVPEAGSWQIRPTGNPNTPPDMEWRFEVADILINDPHFDERIFDVRFPVGTYVVDIRHDASYFLEETGALTGSRLEEMAQGALARVRAHEERAAEVPASIEINRGPRWLLLTIVLVNVGAALAGLIVWRAKRRIYKSR